MAVCSRFFAVLALLLPLYSCASPSNVDPEDIGHIKTVAIISTIGEQIYVPGACGGSSIGPSLRTRNWGIDETVTVEATKALSKKFTIVPAAYDKYVATGIPNTDDYLSKINNPGADAYLLISPVMYAKSDNGLRTFLPDWYRGLSLCLDPPRTIRGQRDILTAYYIVVLVDAHSFQWLGAAASTLDMEEPPLVEVPSNYYAADARNLNDMQKAYLQQRLTDLVTTSLHSTLRSMALE